jgi:ArsR family transcriptional regulator
MLSITPGNQIDSGPYTSLQRPGIGYILISGLTDFKIMTKPAILERLSALADGVRGRMLLLLEKHELTVSELGTVLQLPQSSTSRQLKTLADSGWVVSRPDGTRRLYWMPVSEERAPAYQLWKLTREQIEATAAANDDQRRLLSVLAKRRGRSRAFFETEAAQWDRVRDELFGTRFFLFGLLGLLDPDWVVGDLGCGSGTLSEALAPFARRVLAVDDSEAMLVEARRRLQRFDNVELRHGALEALPIDDEALDAATLVLVLHHVPDADGAVREVARVLRPGGRLLIVDMLPHDRQEYRQSMGHVWLGFSSERIERSFAHGGLEINRFLELPADPAAKGPTLFAATATRGKRLSRHKPSQFG